MSARLHLRLLWCVVISSLGIGCSQSDADALFQEEVQPLLERNCNEACHEPDGFNGELFLGSEYGQERIVEVRSSQAPLNIIEPGDPDGSYMWHKLHGTHREAGGSGEAMPYGSPQLSADDLSIIEEYILALDD